MREFKTLGIVLGMRYVNSPIIIADGSTPPPEHFMLYIPSAHPGCLAPHLWLTDGSSLYDHFGLGFTLLITDGDERAAERLARAATKHQIPLKVLAPTNARLHQRYEARFALIRPDQHVAWRGNDMPADCEALLARVTGTSPKAETTPQAVEHQRVRQTAQEQSLPNKRSSRQLDRKRCEVLSGAML
jgi:hypothetical protein